MPALQLENIPVNIYNKLSYQAKSKNISLSQQVIIFIERGLSNTQTTIKNDATKKLKAFQKSMKGEAKKVGFNSSDDVNAYIKSQRRN